MKPRLIIIDVTDMHIEHNRSNFRAIIELC